MENQEGPFRATLVTKGRISGKRHLVMLRGVKHDGKIYFSRHRPDSDWFRNAQKNPEVEVIYDNSKNTGIAKIITDEELNQKISHLKYPGEKRAGEKRVSIEVTLHEQW